MDPLFPDAFIFTVFENRRKSLILQFCELPLHCGQKLIKNAKNVQFGGFLKVNHAVKQCYQTVIFHWTKIGENPEIENFQCDILTDF